MNRNTNLKLFVFTMILITISACGQKGKKTDSNVIDLTQNEEIQKIAEKLESGMTDYMENSEADYDAGDIVRCMGLLHSFLVKLSVSDSKKEGMKVVEQTVLALNDLNEKSGYQLIETSQREQIAEIIIIAGNLKGYNERSEDITEPWREW